jgi:4a-hydroxytetrahydrobiopterin dehydratase
MPSRELLSVQDIEIALELVPLWVLEDKRIEREFVCSDFISVIGLVNAVAILSEAQNHHPDLTIYGWNKLRISITTFDRGGLTNQDFTLAKKIDKININR